MASSEESHQQKNIARLIQLASSNPFSLLSTLNNNNNPKPSNTKPPISPPSSSNHVCISSIPSSICGPLLFSDPPSSPPLTLALANTTTTTTTPSSPSPTSEKEPSQRSSLSPKSKLKRMPSSSGFPSSVRIANSNGDGPAFVGQVFSMCDMSGNGILAVSTRIEINIPFISKRISGWIEKMYAKITKNDRKDPTFRFFMDLGDAVSYVKQLNIPTGVVGACRLDLAYEHVKEHPDKFQFVPNKKQVKAANKLLKEFPQDCTQRNVDGVPVFTAQNLNIAIATNDGVKWYTPYFFDKTMLDNILEESVDQHFHTLIQTRRAQRLKGVIDDSMSADVFEDNGDIPWEPPEVDEVMDEVGLPGIFLSALSKVAELKLQYTVDQVLLGNRWIRKAAGIQPKFPYMVDSFERRTAASFLKAAQSKNAVANVEAGRDNHANDCQTISADSKESAQDGKVQKSNSKNFQFPFGDWLSNPWLKDQRKPENPSTSDSRADLTRREYIKEVPPSPHLPKITMVGISTGDTDRMSKTSLKKTMKDLTKKLEQTDQNNDNSTELSNKDRDPLFVANVGDYYSEGKDFWVPTRKSN